MKKLSFNKYQSTKISGAFQLFQIPKNHFSKSNFVLNSDDSVSNISKYYPTHFECGLLSAHCSEQTGEKFKNFIQDYNDSKDLDVKLVGKYGTINNFNSSKKYDINDYLQNWKILKVFPDIDSCYLSVLYSSDKNKQLVLAHRSTNFGDSLTTNIFAQSGAQTDWDAVVKGKPVKHQAMGYVATEAAINIVKSEDYKDYSLCTTGHSLGSWLADLSIFYAQNDFDYNMKAVTFDGPGSRQTLELLINNCTKSFKIKTLDKVSYLSAPNIVNCFGNHFGQLYRLYPELVEKNPEGFFKNLLHNIFDTTVHVLGVESLKSTFGHHLKFILPYFDHSTGKPLEFSEIKQWPSIMYNHKWGSNAGGESSTLGAVFNALTETLINGNINFDQFWRVHDFLDAKNKYKSTSKNSIDVFFEKYESHYEVVNSSTERKLQDRFDVELYKIKKNFGNNINGLNGDDYVVQKCKEILKYYNYGYLDKFSTKKVIAVNSEYTDRVNIEDLRNVVRELMHRYKNDFNKLKENVRGLKHKGDTKLKIDSYLGAKKPYETEFVGREEVFNTLQQLFNNKKNKIVFIKGPWGIGKSSFAYKYGQLIKQNKISEFDLVRWLDYSDLFQNYQRLAVDLNIEGQFEFSDLVTKINLALTSLGKKVLLIFNDVNNFDDIKKQIDVLPKNVKLLITTKDGNMQHLYGQTINLQSFNKEEVEQFLQKNSDQDVIKRKISDSDLLKIKKALKLNTDEAFKVKDLPIHLGKLMNVIRENYLSDIEECINIYKEKQKKHNFVKEVFDKSKSINISNLINSWELLKYLSCLNSDFISYDLIKALLKLPSKEFKEALSSLKNRGLINEVNNNNEYGVEIDKSVQEEVKIYMKEHTNYTDKKIIEEILITLNNLIPEISENSKELQSHFIKLELVKLHVELLLPNFVSQPIEKYQLLVKLASYYYFNERNLEKAAEYYEQSLEVCGFVRDNIENDFKKIESYKHDIIEMVGDNSSYLSDGE